MPSPAPANGYPMPSRHATVALVCLQAGLLAIGLSLPGRSPEGARTVGAPLFLQWSRDYPPLRPAWPDQPRLQFDAAYHPVFQGDLVLVSSSRNDSVTALDVATGAERWRFRADGPVRFAPTAWQDKVYFSSDDGHLYCVDAHRGRLLWKFRGGPSGKTVLGNERLVSTWPARGAPVVVPGPGRHEATVYFAAGIWPFMGTFLHALDATDGEVRWTNSGDGSIYIKQPHQTEAFAGIAPQGMLAVSGDRLLVPGGRSVPACFDRGTGRMLHFRLADNSKLGGGPDVQANDHLFISGGAAFDLQTGDWLGAAGDPAVLAGDVLCAAVGGDLRFYDARRAARRPRPADRLAASRAASSLPLVANVPLLKVDALTAGEDRIHVASGRVVRALGLPITRGRPVILSEVAIDGTAAHLAADGDHLLVSTREGRISCFGPRAVEPHRYLHAIAPPRPAADAWGRRAEQVLRESGVREGYCVSWGAGTGRLITELALRSPLRIIAIEPDPARAEAVRRDLEAADLPAERVHVVSGIDRLQLPAYLATLMVSEGLEGYLEATGEPAEALLRTAFASLRPYGGMACLPWPGPKPDLAGWVNDLDLAQAQVRHQGGDLWLVRPGPLPGAADWTHEHADGANTRTSRDRRVKAPLGLLWFGGPGHEGVLPRHGHGPQPQVVGGRAIIEGVDMLRAIDLYTGRLLWQVSLPGVGKAFDNTAHQPGANATGSNYVSLPDAIYVAHGDVCRRFDPATGRQTAAFGVAHLPGESGRPIWEFVSAAGDYLIAGLSPKGGPAKKGFSTVPSTRYLAVLDRKDGRVLWTRTAAGGFRNNTVCAGRDRLFVIDRPAPSNAPWAKAKAKSATPRLVALDLRSGNELWAGDRDVFGTWLSYSAEHDVLVESGRYTRDSLLDEAKGMRAWQGTSGKVLWYRRDYLGPAILRGDMVLRDKGACELRTGEPVRRPDPLTGKLVEWTWARTYGCATPLASEHLLTFRSGAAGFYDLCHDGGTGNLGGFRAGCTNNLIVADGVLAAPDYTRQCTCSYQNQTSLALVPMADAEMWTFMGPQKLEGVIRRVGLNLGAPGNRRADDGTLWLEWPPAGGSAPRPAVRTNPATPPVFRAHEATVSGDGPAWVTASGVRGLGELRLSLVPEGHSPRRYTVRLYFLEPDDRARPGQRRFDVAVQGETVLHALDVCQEAGGPHRGLVHEAHGVRIGAELTVTLTPDPSAPLTETILSGIEVQAEGW